MLVADTDPDLARLLVAWPKLSGTAKRMILVALDADQPDDLRLTVTSSGKVVSLKVMAGQSLSKLIAALSVRVDLQDRAAEVLLSEHLGADKVGCAVTR